MTTAVPHHSIKPLNIYHSAHYHADVNIDCDQVHDRHLMLGCYPGEVNRNGGGGDTDCH